MFGIMPNYELCIRNYEDAMARYKEIDPIKWGKNKGVRPVFASRNLGYKELRLERRKTHMNIQVEGYDVVVKLYHTNILTFKPDNSIVINFDGWATQSSVRFVSAVLGVNVFLATGNIWACPYGVGWSQIPALAQYLSSTGDNILKFTNIRDGEVLSKSIGIDVTSAKPLLRRKINRSSTKKYTAPYQEFFKYVRLIAKLRCELDETTFGINNEEIDTALDDAGLEKIHRISELLPLLENGKDSAAYYKGMCKVLALTQVYSLGYRRGRDIYVSAETILRHVRKTIYGINVKEVTVEEEVTNPYNAKSSV